MAAPASCDQFLELIEKSLILDRERLEQYFQQRPELPPDAKELANQLWRDGLLTFYQARMLLSGKYKGFVFGKYKVLDQVGSGGEGNVYLCEHLLMRRRVAVKVLPIDRAADPGLLERFYREARAAAALDHPNIVRVHDIDQEGDLHFLVMEYVDGSSLQRIIKKKGPMEILRAVNYVRQAAVGLQHVHEAGLVHRDIKPGNLLLDRGGVMKLLDLGLARFFNDRKDALTQQYDESAVLGTADYISPEQGMNSHAVDIRADIYSLGATFYFLLAGRAPFEGGTVTQKLLFHQIREPEPIRSVRVAVPEAMAAVLTRMLAKDASARYQTPAQVIDELTPWLQDLPTPPEDEMPKLSATTDQTFSESGPVSKTLSKLGGGSSMGGRRRAQEPLSTKRMQGPKTVMSRLPTAELLPVPVAPRPGGALAPVRARTTAPAPVRQPSQALQDTDVPRMADTKTMRRPKKRKFKLKAAAASRNVQYIVGGSVGAVVLGVVGYLVLPLMIGNWGLNKPVEAGQGRAAAPVPPASRRAEEGPDKITGVIQVSKHGASGAHRTVGEALAKAPPGSRILVYAQDGVHEETLRIDKPIANDLTIEGDTRSGKALVWKLPGNAKDHEPLIFINHAEGLKFKGIAFDGNGRGSDLVVLSGRCPGVSFEETPFANYRRSAVTFRGCQGDLRKPVALTRARFTTNRDTESALIFEGALSRDVDVRDCRFEGNFRSALQLAGPVDGVGFHRNRFLRAQTGLLYRKGAPVHKARVELVANTFYECGKGLHFEAVPPGGEKCEFVVQQNLFARVQTPTQVDDFAAEPEIISAQWVWFNEASDPARAAPPGACFFRKTFTLPEQTFAGARLSIVCDDSFTLWVNGQQVGAGEFSPATRRVHAFDVSPHLKTGQNVVGVQGVNKTSGHGPSPAGLLLQLATKSGPNPVLLASDSTWKSSKTNDPGWQTEQFDDSAWQPVRVLASYGKGDAAWQNLVWDAVVGDKFKGGLTPFQNATTNVRDGNVQATFPPLEWKGMDGINLPTDASKDRDFLRYSKNHPLARAGPRDSPVGVPPLD